MNYGEYLKDFEGYYCCVTETSKLFEILVKEKRYSNVQEALELCNDFDCRVLFQIVKLGDDFINLRAYLKNGFLAQKEYILPLSIIHFKLFED